MTGISANKTVISSSKSEADTGTVVIIVILLFILGCLGCFGCYKLIGVLDKRRTGGEGFQWPTFLRNPIIVAPIKSSIIIKARKPGRLLTEVPLQDEMDLDDGEYGIYSDPAADYSLQSPYDNSPEDYSPFSEPGTDLLYLQRSANCSLCLDESDNQSARYSKSHRADRTPRVNKRNQDTTDSRHQLQSDNARLQTSHHYRPLPAKSAKSSKVKRKSSTERRLKTYSSYSNANAIEKRSDVLGRRWLMKPRMDTLLEEDEGTTTSTPSRNEGLKQSVPCAECVESSQSRRQVKGVKRKYQETARKMPLNKNTSNQRSYSFLEWTSVSDRKHNHPEQKLCDLSSKQCQNNRNSPKPVFFGQSHKTREASNIKQDYPSNPSPWRKHTLFPVQRQKGVVSAPSLIQCSSSTGPRHFRSSK